jgi:two-component system, NtrC family, nitrogen regulation sensor histidine kinase NtrY
MPPLNTAVQKRVSLGLGAVALAILIALLVWQGSFTLGEYRPSPHQTFIFWGISTLIFLLTVTLGFMLFRTAVKLYIERQSNREGSRIRSKLIVGALALSFVPVIFLVFFDYSVLNRNLRIWFTNPAEGITYGMDQVRIAIQNEFEAKVQAQARWIATLPETHLAAAGGIPGKSRFAAICSQGGISKLTLRIATGRTLELCPGSRDHATNPDFTVSVPVEGADALLVETSRLPIDLARTKRDIDRNIAEYNDLSRHRTQVRNFYYLYMTLITLFVLFVSTWIARMLADQISNPIAALLRAAGEVRKGNLSHRVHVKAVDELATLVRGFNEMTQELEANSKELESRRRFTETILESIPTGVISISADGRIQRVNRALKGIFPSERIERAAHLRDLFSHDDAAEIRYLIKRARRTGLAASQLDFTSKEKIMHLAVTVSALEEKGNSGFVIVLEDTSDLLRAQKASAWQEVARRIAHEMKNPLTPIGLSAERIARQIDRGNLATPEAQRIIHECSRTIVREVASVKLLVDEFSQFARFPTAQPVRSDLNEVVRNALEVFSGRLHEVKLQLDLADSLPQVNVDPEQFKRVVINLVDNAAEAMHDSLVRRLLVATQAPSPDVVELTVADTGHGVSAEEKEKLFLPYFSTKSRGTGLGLAIVSRIVADHNGTIRIEENKPEGARFIVEIPAVNTGDAEEEIKAVETRA